MNSIRLAIVGAGSVRCSAPIIASLATYFGERQIDVALYDADAERLDLFTRLAKVAFAMTRATHEIQASTDPEDSVPEANKIVVAFDANCARKFLRPGAKSSKLKGKDSAILQGAASSILANAREDADVLSLLPASINLPLQFYYRLEWPDEPTDRERAEVPHQVLRWVRSEDYMHEYLKRFEDSPLKMWLNEATSAHAVVGRR